MGGGLERKDLGGEEIHRNTYNDTYTKACILAGNMYIYRVTLVQICFHILLIFGHVLALFWPCFGTIESIF